MARFLIKASYSVEGTKGLLKEGGSGRRNAVKQALEALGGRLETIYFAYGDDDTNRGGEERGDATQRADHGSSFRSWPLNTSALSTVFEGPSPCTAMRPARRSR